MGRALGKGRTSGAASVWPEEGRSGAEQPPIHRPLFPPVRYGGFLASRISEALRSLPSRLRGSVRNER